MRAPLRDPRARPRFVDDAKTAHGVIRYGNDDVVAVIDPSIAGRRVRDVLPYLQSDAPIVATVTRALEFTPNALLIGTAPKGGGLPPAWRGALQKQSRRARRSSAVCTKCSTRIASFTPPRAQPGRRIWDVRKPPTCRSSPATCTVSRHRSLLTVGNECAVGKMTVSLELVAAANAAGKHGTLCSDRANRNLDRRLGHLGRSRHRRFCGRGCRTTRALCGAPGRRSRRRRGSRRNQSSSLRAR